MTQEDPLQGTYHARGQMPMKILEVQEDKLALERGNCTTMHLEVQEDKLDFQSITGRVFILLLICLSLLTIHDRQSI